MYDKKKKEKEAEERRKREYNNKVENNKKSLPALNYEGLYSNTNPTPKATASFEVQSKGSSIILSASLPETIENKFPLGINHKGFYHEDLPEWKNELILYKEKITSGIFEKTVRDYCVFDLETTGLNSNYDKIIEVACVRVRDNKIVYQWSTLVNPHRHIPYQASDINHITDDMVNGAPELIDVLKEFLIFIENDILVGQNIKTFDCVFLYNALKKCGLPPIINQSIDTRYLPSLCPKSSLAAYCEYYGIRRNIAHRACDDACDTQQVFEKLQEESDCLDGLFIFNQYEPDVMRYRTNVLLKNVYTINTIINDFHDKSVCLTGDFEYGEKWEIKKYLESKGAIIKNSAIKKLDYLIIGNLGSIRWTDEYKGSAIEKVLNYNATGCNIGIVSEFIAIDRYFKTNQKGL
jgi:DNA polymerase-3 subunit epsilon